MSRKSLPLSPYTLRFHDDAVEASYQREYAATSVSIVRVTLMMGALLYAAYGYLDYLLVPHDTHAIWTVRFPIVLLILLVFALTYVERLRHRLDLIMSSLIVVAGADVTMMMWLWPKELGHLYVTGLMMVFMYAHGHLRLRFVHATIATLIVVAFYAVIMPVETLVQTGSTVAGAVLLCMFASYAIEFFGRKSFWHHMLLREQREQLEAEYARKTKELDAARRLQLSLLPNEVPGVDHADIAVAMRPAMEIGGDYYDFDTNGDVVTFAIGDATGHGAEAGAMVTATKILFASLCREPRIENILVRSSATLKRVGINKLYMALAVGRITPTELHLAGAGMPPAIIYRARTGICEQVALKGMPLGSFAEFPYATTRTRLEPGDTVILMSDGFPEAFNESGEMLGYERAFELVQSVAKMNPSDMIWALMDRAREWCGRHPITDDITFMVMRSGTPASREERTAVAKPVHVKERRSPRPRGVLEELPG
ncbi:MAG TPA: SpoIIE family protein phosphatase [Rhodothermales bacterium]